MGVKAGPLARPEGAMALTLMKRKYPAARGWWLLFAASPRGAGEGPAAGGDNDHHRSPGGLCLFRNSQEHSQATLNLHQGIRVDAAEGRP